MAESALPGPAPRQLLAQPSAVASNSVRDTDAMRFEHEPGIEGRVMAKLLLRSWRLNAEVDRYRLPAYSLE
ncbi:MAG: hypothetical protein KIS79_08100 [Burkholderiales bacterium]|nr:hypothetical protein [Burkholderiales bacterium]